MIAVVVAAALAAASALSLAAALSCSRRDPGERVRPPVRATAGIAVAGLGRVLRRGAGRPPDGRADRRLGATVVAFVAGCVVAAPVGAGAAVAAWTVPPVLDRRAVARARAAVIDELPDAIDLFALAVGAGLNLRLAVEAVAPRAPPRLSAALFVALDRVAAGDRLADAIERVPAELGDAVRPLVATLAASDRYGSPLGPALERLAADARSDRRRRAEASARRVPVKLLFPLVLCVLPAFALLTVVPILIGTLRSLRL